MSDHDISIFNLTLSSYLFKRNLKIDEKFNAKVYKTMIFEIMLQKRTEKICHFLNCPILRFDFQLQNSNIFAKTVCAVRKYNKIPPELFQTKFSYLILIKTFAII